jgi:hypothetical protein
LISSSDSVLVGIFLFFFLAGACSYVKEVRRLNAALRAHFSGWRSNRWGSESSFGLDGVLNTNDRRRQFLLKGIHPRKQLVHHLNYGLAHQFLSIQSAFTVGSFGRP